MNYYSIHSNSIVGIADGWVEDIDLDYASQMLAKAINVNIPKDIVKLFKEIYRCGGDDQRFTVENSRTSHNLTLQLYKYDSEWEVFVDWRQDKHRVQFKEYTTDIMESLNWILDKIPA